MAKRLEYSSNQDIINNFIEISIDPALFNNLSTDDSMGAYFNSYASTEEFKALKADLYKEVMCIINNNLTDKQKQVVIMTYVDGKTQNEISNELGKHQTAIHKAIKGNIDYGNDGKRYGGALKKIRKICSNNQKIQDILLKMRDGCGSNER